MRNLKPLLLIVAATLLITACKKDKNKKSNTELLTQNSWVMLKFEEKEGNGNWTDIFFLVDDCSKDDRWQFNPDKSLDLTEGAVACSGNTPNEILESTVWALIENDTKLQTGIETATIEKLDDNTLIISSSEVNGGVTSYTRVTLGH